MGSTSSKVVTARSVRLVLTYVVEFHPSEYSEIVQHASSLDAIAPASMIVYLRSSKSDTGFTLPQPLIAELSLLRLLKEGSDDERTVQTLKSWETP